MVLEKIDSNHQRQIKFVLDASLPIRHMSQAHVMWEEFGKQPVSGYDRPYGFEQRLQGILFVQVQ